MKKKALYYTRANQNDPANYGVANKCEGQVEGLRNLGWDVDYIWLNKKGVCLNNGIIHSYPVLMTLFPIFNYFFLYFRLHIILRKKIDFLNYELIYIRYELSHPQFIKTLKKIKKDNPNVKLVLELPTYPYGLEQKGLFRKMQYFIDRRDRRHLKDIINLVVHFGIDKKIFGIPTFCMGNGIDVCSIDSKSADPVPGEIHLIAVGTWNYWHGLDRLIVGLGSYYINGTKKEKVYLTIIGDGKAVPAYRKLISQLKLGDYVKMIPSVPKEYLDLYFSKANIGIGTLAIFRKGLQFDSSLKHREYCARGIPFILSTTDLDFPKSIPWVHYIPENESPVSIDSLIDFFYEIKKEGKIKKAIRKYAETNLTWEKKMSQLFSEIKDSSTLE